jgi:hypothetical protein
MNNVDLAIWPPTAMDTNIATNVVGDKSARLAHAYAMGETRTTHDPKIRFTAHHGESILTHDMKIRFTAHHGESILGHKI